MSETIKSARVTCDQCRKEIGRIELDSTLPATKQKERLVVEHRDNGQCSVWNEIVSEYNAAMSMAPSKVLTNMFRKIDDDE